MSEYLNYAGGDAEFAAWLQRLDLMTLATYGVSVFDLVDYPWRDVYESGDEPDEALLDAVDDGLLD
jgi:hypothetical protein